MPICQAANLSYQLTNGAVLFENISFSLHSRLTGLVGSNGVGKSVLASLISGARKPTMGQIHVTYPVAVYDQQTDDAYDDCMTVAQYLGVEPVLDAIRRVTEGECSEELFDRIGDDWMVEKNLCDQLLAIGLPPDIHFNCRNLSGGQLTRLRLWYLFYHHKGLLLLDEPSNHLDRAGKHWLVNEMHRYSGCILLISHDRMMLREVDEIWELSKLGLARYGGNYDFYRHEKTLMAAAVEREIGHLKRQEKKLNRKLQSNREKADKRAAQGNRIRKSGSQATVLLDYQKNSAEAAASARRKQDAAQVENLKQKATSLRERQETWQVVRLTLPDRTPLRGQVLTLNKVKLPFGSQKEVNMQLSGANKIRLLGSNGCGKSTLLKVIEGDLQPLSGEVRLKSKTSYLDQNFSWINGNMTVLNNFMHAAEELDEPAARARLAGAGLTADEIGKPADQLSGGQMMKLAVLMVGFQPGQPLLLLDEPDNHLDLDSKRVLADALKQYQGPFMIVTHDNDFAAACGISHNYELAAN